MTTSVQITPDMTVVEIAPDQPVVQITDEPVAVTVEMDDCPTVVIEVEETLHTVVAGAPTVLIDAEHEVQVNVSDVATIIGTTGGNSFLSRPDRKDDTPADFFYFGWASIEGTWAVQRQPRGGGPVAWARFSNNPSAPNLDAAWPDRETLNYA